jgi:hypothetical protein
MTRRVSSALPGPPTFAVQTSNSPTVSNTTFAVATGTASATRFVVVVITGTATVGGATITGSLFDGTVSGTNYAVGNGNGGGGTNNGMWIVTALIPTGTSSTLVITWSPSMSGTMRFTPYTTDSTTLNSLVPVTSNSIVNSTSNSLGSIAVANSGSAIFTCTTGGSSLAFSAGTPTITVDDNFNVTRTGHAFSVGAGSYTIASTWTPSADNIIGAAVFR